LIVVSLDDPDVDDGAVAVDESLSTPPTPTEPTEASPLARPEVPVLALGGVALLVALLAALYLQDTLVLVGSLVVLGGVIVALYLLSRG
jgi:hypothetical protein